MKATSDIKQTIAESNQEDYVNFEMPGKTQSNDATTVMPVQQTDSYGNSGETVVDSQHQSTGISGGMDISESSFQEKTCDSETNFSHKRYFSEFPGSKINEACLNESTPHELFGNEQVCNHTNVTESPDKVRLDETVIRKSSECMLHEASLDRTCKTVDINALNASVDMAGSMFCQDVSENDEKIDLASRPSEIMLFESKCSAESEACSKQLNVVDEIIHSPFMQEAKKIFGMVKDINQKINQTLNLEKECSKKLFIEKSESCSLYADNYENRNITIQSE